MQNTFKNLSSEDKIKELKAVQDELRISAANYSKFMNPEVCVNIEAAGHFDEDETGVSTDMHFAKEIEKIIQENGIQSVQELYKKQREAFNVFADAIAKTSLEAIESVQAEIDSLLKQ